MDFSKSVLKFLNTTVTIILKSNMETVTTDYLSIDRIKSAKKLEGVTLIFDCLLKDQSLYLDVRVP